MTSAMYQIYTVGNVEGDAFLVGVAYPKGGGSAILEKRIKLSSIGCDLVKNVNRVSLGATEVGIKNIKRHGLKLTVNYDRNCAYITPLGTAGPIREKTVKYDFDQLGIEYSPDTAIQKAKDKDEFRITPEVKPVSDETYDGRN